jgi:aminoglycoside 3-N-acetyltransferase I
MDIAITKLTHNDTADFSDLLALFEAVFEWDNFSLPNPSYLRQLLENPAFFVFVAKYDKKVVGGLTVYVLDRYDTEKKLAYIYDLGVTTALQRKGIGTMLIAAVNDFCIRNGFSEAFVQAETGDTHAVNFYRTTPIRSEMSAIQFTYSYDAKKDSSE